ncbi:MAG: sugar ABC transporter substrate-binding protein [Bifidobacterium sp.]|nr:sugar ABC transporter substrate-binding protein [Bifidobacterium sp.]
MKRLGHSVPDTGKGARTGLLVLVVLVALAFIAGAVFTARDATARPATVSDVNEDVQAAAHTTRTIADRTTVRTMAAPDHTKTIKANSDGTYTLSMQVKGASSETPVQDVTPLDIALVLDVSGSMDDPASCTYAPVSSLDASKIAGQRGTQTYYITADDGTHHKVQYQEPRGWRDHARGVDTTTGGEVNPNETQLQAGSCSTTTRLDALKSSVTTFLAGIKAQNQKISNDADKIRVTLVKYAGEETRTGNMSDLNDGTDRYRECWTSLFFGTTCSAPYNYSKILEPLTANMDTLTQKVNALQAGGPTRADYGLQLAATALRAGQGDTARQAATPERLTIFYSDGSPTSGSEFEPKVANAALGAAHTLKHDLGADIYSVDANSDAAEGSSTKNFMQYASSNYPDATSMTAPGTRASGEYYNLVSNQTDLTDVFAKLIRVATSGAAYQGVAMRDTLSQYAQFAQPTAQAAGARLVVRNASGAQVDPATVGLTQGTYAIAANATQKTVSLTLPTDYTLRDGYTYALEYDVEPTTEAYEQYAANVNANKSAYADAEGTARTGDPNTDAQGNATSAGKPGFRSNQTATLDYTPRIDGVAGTPVTGVPMPHPVLQVDTALLARLTVTKRWLGMQPNAGKVTIDIACRDASGATCAGMQGIDLSADTSPAWSRTLLVAPADSARTLTVSERAVDGTRTAYDTGRSWTLAANAGGTHTTTVTNYPSTAPIALSTVRVGKTVANTGFDGDFSFSLAADSGQAVTNADGTAFTTAHATVDGPFTQGKQRTAGFTGNVRVATPRANTTTGDGSSSGQSAGGSRAWRFTVSEDDPNADGQSTWQADTDRVGVTLTVKQSADGLPVFNADGTLAVDATYTYAAGDTDGTAANQHLAAFTNRLAPTSKLPLTGAAGGSTPRRMAIAGGGIGALAILAAAGTALLRRKLRR